MTFDPAIHHRRSIRLLGFDYSQPGAYFITICVQRKKCLFGQIIDGEMLLNDAGQMIRSVWNEMPDRYPRVGIDAFVVMPNHVHGIIIIATGDVCDKADVNVMVGAGLVPAPGATTRGATTRGATTRGATTRVAPTVGDIMGAFKSLTTVLYTRGVKQSGWPAFRGRLWQRNYYERIIRNEDEWNRIRQYIEENTLTWGSDRENPTAPGLDDRQPWQIM